MIRSTLLLLLLLLSTISCSKEPTENNTAPPETNTLMDAVGEYEVEVIRNSTDTILRTFTLAAVTDTSFAMTLGDFVSETMVASQYQAVDSIINYGVIEPNSNSGHIIRQLTYNHEANSIIGFACVCYMVQQTTYDWEVSH